MENTEDKNDEKSAARAIFLAAAEYDRFPDLFFNTMIHHARKHCKGEERERIINNMTDAKNK